MKPDTVGSLLNAARGACLEQDPNVPEPELGLQHAR